MPVGAFLITDEFPVLTTIRLRPSEVSSTRLKAVFTADMNDSPVVINADGSEVPLPDEMAGQTIALCKEFRIELN